MLTIVDHNGPSCIFQRPKSIRAPRFPGKADPIWDTQLKPKFEPKKQGMVTPYNTAFPWHAMTFSDRHTELSWLIETQLLELADTPTFFSANGMKAISLSSSPAGEDDDDLEAANIAESHLGIVPYAPDPETIAPILRQIEWEKYRFACGQPVRIYVKTTENGSRTLACNDRRWTKDQLAAYAPRFRETMGELPPQEEIENNRARAAHYGKLVWSLMTPEQQLAWTRRDPEVRAYLDCADSNRERENWALDEEPARQLVICGACNLAKPKDETIAGQCLACLRLAGPQELGFHGDGGELVIDGQLSGHTAESQATIVPVEPTDADLWPLFEDDFISFSG